MSPNPRKATRALTLLISIASTGPAFSQDSPAPGKGFVVLSAGTCAAAPGQELKLLSFRRAGTRDRPGTLHAPPRIQVPSEQFGITKYEELGYKDEFGDFMVSIHQLAAGEWTIVNHLILFSGGDKFAKAKADYDYRFTIVPGKVTYLGRYCPMSQDRMVENFVGMRVRRVEVNYLLVTRNLEKDLATAAIKEPVLKTLEVIDATPKNPSAVTPLLRSVPVEPQLIDDAKKGRS